MNLLQYCFCFMFWFFGPEDLSSLTRDQTCTPCIGRESLNHWTAREVPQIAIFKKTRKWTFGSVSAVIAFSGFNWAYYMMISIFSLLLMYNLRYFKSLFNNCYRVCNISLQLIQVHFQIIPSTTQVMQEMYNKEFPIFPSHLL